MWNWDLITKKCPRTDLRNNENEIDYKSPALLGDEIMVRGWLAEIGKVRFWCAFEIIRTEDQLKLVTCKQQLALVKMPGGKPLRLPAEWREGFNNG